MQNQFKAMIFTVASLISLQSFASDSVMQGWWFYQAPAKEQAPQHQPRVIAKKAQTTTEIPKKINCYDEKQWVSACGFVIPQSLSFEQKEMKALLGDYSVKASPSAVYQFQRFNEWVIGQAMTASYTWQYNMTQHPELDPNAKNPLSRFGNLLMSRLEDGAEQDFFKKLSESASFVYFTRSDCAFCHAEAGAIKMLSHDTGIEVWDVSLDSQPLAGFKKTIVAPQSIKPAEYLHVSIVPTLFLYLEPNSVSKMGARWIRVATGVTDEETMKKRIINFVQAYRNAVLVGEGKNKHWQPNFRANRMHELVDGNGEQA